jgi:exodeoxyribonuclease V alpha subunit
MPETLSGFIERVTYHNPETGFAVLRVKVRGRSDLVSVVGSTTSVTASEHLEASGQWVIDRQHGQQFRADQLKTTHPASAEGIEKYPASGAVRSVGPKLAAKIVSVYGDRTLDIFENHSEILLHVRASAPSGPGGSATAGRSSAKSAGSCCF